jgi:ATP-dependent DNA helicase RecG
MNEAVVRFLSALTVGLFSSMVPEFDERAFMEDSVNALGHRE